MIIFGANLSPSSSSLHSKKEELSLPVLATRESNCFSIIFTTHIFSRTSNTLATASKFVKSVILTICSNLSQLALKVYHSRCSTLTLFGSEFSFKSKTLTSVGSFHPSVLIISSLE
jgi:hypothetical protein